MGKTEYPKPEKTFCTWSDASMLAAAIAGSSLRTVKDFIYSHGGQYSELCLEAMANACKERSGKIVIYPLAPRGSWQSEASEMNHLEYLGWKDLEIELRGIIEKNKERSARNGTALQD